MSTYPFEIKTVNDMKNLGVYEEICDKCETIKSIESLIRKGFGLDEIFKGAHKVKSK